MMNHDDDGRGGGGGGNQHQHNNSCCWMYYNVRRLLRLRCIFLGLLALGYTVTAIAIYRNILMLVHRTDDSFGIRDTDITMIHQQIYDWMNAQLPTTTTDLDDDDTPAAAVVNVMNASQDDYDNNDNAPGIIIPRNNSVALTTSITTTITTTPFIENASQADSAETTKNKTSKKFYMLQIPELTSNLVQQYWDKAYKYGEKAMNEDLAEIWLHRGLSKFTYQQGQTLNPSEADVYFIPAYLHGRDAWIQTTEQHRKDILTIILNAMIDKTKPHVLLIPTRDKSLGSKIGYRLVAQTLWDLQQQEQLHLGNDNNIKSRFRIYSVGFERNSWWQVIPTDRIIPIPYVVKKPPPIDDNNTIMFEQVNRTENFIFYAAHPRPLAMSFAGCNRSTVLPLQNQDNMEILLLHDKQRLSQERYNYRMLTSDYCLITCGDTPTSRSLASAMVTGCIPLRIGSWWRAICETPCKKIRMGFNVAKNHIFLFSKKFIGIYFPK